MTYVVGENCIRCKHTDCVVACPVNCFYEGPNFLAIHPDECIDCALCVPKCPVNAIYPEDELPEDQLEFVALNRELSAHWPQIRKRQPALADSDKWNGVPGKRTHLRR